MWLEAIIAQEDLIQVMRELLPLKIHLNHDVQGEPTAPERWLLLHPATQVVLVPEQGLQVTCPAELRWSFAYVSPTAKLDELRVLIRPQVVEKNKGCVLEFHIEVEEADFRSLPEFVDARLVKAVNRTLAEKVLTWNFTEFFSRQFGLGKALEPVEALKLEVLWGKHRIGADAMTLVVSLKVSFVRGD